MQNAVNLKMRNIHFLQYLWVFRDLEDSSMDEGSIENQERGSLASFGSGNTTDSEKVCMLMQYNHSLLMHCLNNF